jgi:transglutaminase-like putative cysteine protease
MLGGVGGGEIVKRTELVKTVWRVALWWAVSSTLPVACVSTVTREQIEEAYSEGKEEALERIVGNPDLSDSQEDLALAEAYLADLKVRRVQAEVDRAIEGKDEIVLDAVVSGEYDKYLTDDQTREATAVWREVTRDKVEREIQEGIRKGDCEILYRYAVELKEDVDIVQQRVAKNALNAYLVPDPVPYRYKTDRMDVTIRGVQEPILSGVFQQPEAYLEKLVSRLCAGQNDLFRRAKILHDWIADNISYDTADYFGRLQRPQDPVSVLRRKTAVCAGYSSLFEHMALSAGFDAVTIRGYSKGFGYTGKVGGEPDHAWNSVRINNKWYLVDVTWDAGYVDRKTFIKKYSTSYLFIEPRHCLYSHLPAESVRQYWYPYVTGDMFVSEPMIGGSFFQYGLQLTDESLRYRNRIDQEVFSVRLKSNRSNVILSCQLRNENGEDVPGHSYYERKGGSYTFLYSPQSNEEQRALVFANWKGMVSASGKIPASQFEQVLIPRIVELVSEGTLSTAEQDAFLKAFFKVEENASYYFVEDQFAVARNKSVIHVSDALGLSKYWMEAVLSVHLQRGSQTTRVPTFPEVFGKYHELLGTELIEPLQYSIPAGQAVQFRIKSSDSSKWLVIVDGTPLHFRREPDGTLLLEIVAPVGEREIVVWSSLDGRGYMGVFRFVVE